MKPLLEIKNLSVNYGAVKALKNVSLRIEEKSVVTLLGANGAGKSTLMKSILGVIPAASGEILFRSKNLLGMKNHQIVRQGISLSPEGRQVFADMSVRENLYLGAYSANLSGKQVETRMDEMMDLFPILHERRDQFAGTLSGGEQQMLAIARALMISPELLLLDEPSLGISPLLTEKIFESLLELNRRGTAILLAEQNAGMALEVAHYGYVIELGEVVHEASSSLLLEDDRIRKAYLGI